MFPTGLQRLTKTEKKPTVTENSIAKKTYSEYFHAKLNIMHFYYINFFSSSKNILFLTKL